MKNNIQICYFHFLYIYSCHRWEANMCYDSLIMKCYCTYGTLAYYRGKASFNVVFGNVFVPAMLLLET